VRAGVGHSRKAGGHGGKEKVTQEEMRRDLFFTRKKIRWEKGYRLRRKSALKEKPVISQETFAL